MFKPVRIGAPSGAGGPGIAFDAPFKFGMPFRLGGKGGAGGPLFPKPGGNGGAGGPLFPKLGGNGGAGGAELFLDDVDVVFGEAAEACCVALVDE